MLNEWLPIDLAGVVTKYVGSFEGVRAKVIKGKNKVTCFSKLSETELVTGHTGGGVKIINIFTGATKLLFAFQTPVMQVAALPNGNVASLSRNAHFILWSSRTRKRVAVLNHIWNFAVFTDGVVACAQIGGTIYTDVHHFKSPFMHINQMLEVGGHLAVASEQGVSVWTRNKVSMEKMSSSDQQELAARCARGEVAVNTTQYKEAFAQFLQDPVFKDWIACIGDKRNVTDRDFAILKLDDGTLVSGDSSGCCFNNRTLVECASSAIVDLAQVGTKTVALCDGDLYVFD